MVAGLLVTGDATVAAAGTVTEVDGDQVWAFGHPFLGGGHLALPMARASVVAVLPSQLSSFKFFNVGEVVGALEVDRTHGVWGRLGRSVPLVPVDVEVHGRSYHFESVRHPVLLPLMVAYVTHSSYAARGRTFGEQTVGLRIEVVYAGGHEAVVEETYASVDAAARAAALSSALVAYLEGSPFTAPMVERVQVQLRAAERFERAEIVDAIADRSVVRPGETVNVRIRLRRFRGDMVERRMQIVVPRELPAGRVDVVVADGASWTAYDMQMRPLRPASFDDELQLVGRLIPSTRLVLALERREVGVVVPGGSMAAPPSVVVTLRSGLGPNLETTTHRVVHVVEEAMAVPVLGAQRIPLLVRQDGETGRSNSPAAAAP